MSDQLSELSGSQSHLEKEARAVEKVSLARSLGHHALRLKTISPESKAGSNLDLLKSTLDVNLSLQEHGQALEIPKDESKSLNDRKIQAANETELGLRLMGAQLPTESKESKESESYHKKIDQAANVIDSNVQAGLIRPEIDPNLTEKELDGLLVEYRQQEGIVEKTSTGPASWADAMRDRIDDLETRGRSPDPAIRRSGITDARVISDLRLAEELGEGGRVPDPAELEAIRKHLVDFIMLNPTLRTEAATAIKLISEFEKAENVAQADAQRLASIEYYRGPGALIFEKQLTEFKRLTTDQEKVKKVREYFGKAYIDTIKDKQGKGLTPDKTREGSYYFFLDYLVNNKESLSLSDTVHQEVDTIVTIFKVRHSIGGTKDTIQASDAIFGFTGKDLNFLFRNIGTNAIGTMAGGGDLTVANFIELIDAELRGEALKSTNSEGARNMKYGSEWEKVVSQARQKVFDSAGNPTGAYARYDGELLSYLLNVAEYTMLDLGVQSTYFHKNAVPMFWLANILRPDLYMESGDNPPGWLKRQWLERMPCYVADYFRMNIPEYRLGTVQSNSYPEFKVFGQDLVKLFAGFIVPFYTPTPKRALTFREVAALPILANQLRAIDWSEDDVRGEGKTVAPKKVISPFNYYVDTIAKTSKFAGIVQKAGTNPYVLTEELLKVYNDEDFLSHLSAEGRSRVLETQAEFMLEYYSPPIVHVDIPIPIVRTLLGPLTSFASYVINGGIQMLPIPTQEWHDRGKAGMEREGLNRWGSKERSKIIKEKISPYIQNSLDRILLHRRYDKRYPVIAPAVLVGKTAVIDVPVWFFTGVGKALLGIR